MALEDSPLPAGNPQSPAYRQTSLCTGDTWWSEVVTAASALSEPGSAGGSQGQ